MRALPLLYAILIIIMARDIDIAAMLFIAAQPR